MLEKSKKQRSFGNAFGIFFQITLHIISGKSLTNIYKKKDKKEQIPEDSVGDIKELEENATKWEKLKQKTKIGLNKAKKPFVKFGNACANGLKNFKEKMKKAFSSEKDSIKILYKETMLLLSKKFNISMDNIKKIFTTYIIFIFAIPIAGNIALIIISIFFPIPWIISVIVIGISIPLYINILYFTVSFFPLLHSIYIRQK